MSASSERKAMREALAPYALMTTGEVAAFLQCSKPTARKRLEELGVPVIGPTHDPKVDPVDLFLAVVAERAGKTVDAYLAEHGEAQAVDNARRYYRRVRRFAA